jgi:4-amino-4-deoxy-L-arabinose transferase-like glycosyltransferase
VSLFVVGMALATVVVAVMVSFFGRYQPDGSPRKRKSTVQSLVTFLVAMALLTIVVRSLAGSVGPRLRPPAPQGAAGGGDSSAAPARYEPEFTVWPVLAVAALAGIAVVAWWLAARGRRQAREPHGTTPAEALADVLAETLDDLRAERDPRRAVIAAYARMERALAASGLPRDPSEAPEEYLRKILSDLAVTGRAAARLTSLFAWARFSGHDVRPEMKEEAIETLEQVQHELAAADAARRAELAGAAA